MGSVTKSTMIPVRGQILRIVNEARSRSFRRRIVSDKIPVYIVVTPHLLHLAPIAARNHGRSFLPIFIGNGLSIEDRTWLKSVCPEVSILPLRASLGKNPDSLIEHGVVIDYLAQTESGFFCIQDADCFVTHVNFWDRVSLDLEKEYAVGPFTRKPSGDQREFPETFLLGLNAPLLTSLRKSYGIRSGTTSSTPNRRAQTLLTNAGYPPGNVLESLKDYWDTLQQYWIAATHLGYKYRHLEGEDSDVFHIGGTSYLFNRFDDLAHWDYWPLAVHYFHLRLLEFPACKPIRNRFIKLFEHHHSSHSLLKKHPGFEGGRRHKNIEIILHQMEVASVLQQEPT